MLRTTRFSPGFWVAQRFSAAITPPSFWVAQRFSAAITRPNNSGL